MSTKTLKVYSADAELIESMRFELSIKLGKVVTKIQAIHLFLQEAKKSLLI